MLGSEGNGVGFTQSRRAIESIFKALGEGEGQCLTLWSEGVSLEESGRHGRRVHLAKV